MEISLTGFFQKWPWPSISVQEISFSKSVQPMTTYYSRKKKTKKNKQKKTQSHENLWHRDYLFKRPYLSSWVIFCVILKKKILNNRLNDRKCGHFLFCLTHRKCRATHNRKEVEWKIVPIKNELLKEKKLFFCLIIEAKHILMLFERVV